MDRQLWWCECDSLLIPLLYAYKISSSASLTTLASGPKKFYESYNIGMSPSSEPKKREFIVGGVIVCFFSFSLITHEYRVKEAIIKVESSKNWISSKKQIGHLLFVILVVCFSFYALSKRWWWILDCSNCVLSFLLQSFSFFFFFFLLFFGSLILWWPDLVRTVAHSRDVLPLTWQH